MLRIAAIFLFPLSTQADTISYNQEVRPILSDKCFLCHGPDIANNKGDLRLDRPEDAYAALKETIGHAIVPGKPDVSFVWKRIQSTDPDEIMPPPESNLSLSPKEKETLRLWIEQGAKYEKHWAFLELPEAIEVPEDSDQPVDAFVARRLKQEDLQPSTPANPLRWLRRVTLDLTGLPPTTGEIHAFDKESKSQPTEARTAVVERLLSSPAYGEHMAVAWLDAARYADSYGYQSDQLNNQWPFRDWVVRAFNSNLPYDDFLTWQLAGDLLDHPTTDQRLATAFNRLHRLTNEGGSIREEWMAENAADRVHTFGTTFLSLTLECSRCHDHKYDPISTREYYGLTSFFNSIDENGLYDHAAKIPSPSMLLPTPEQTNRLEQTRAGVAAAEQSHRSTLESARARFTEWIKNPGLTPSDPDLEAHYDFESSEGGKFPNLVPNSDHLGHVNGVSIIDGPTGKALKLNGDQGPSFPSDLHIDRFLPFTVQLRMRDPERNAAPAVVIQRSFGTDVGYNGFDLMLEDGHLSARLYRVWPGNGLGVRTTTPIPPEKWSQIAVSYDGSSRAAGLRIFINGIPAETTVLRDKMMKSALIHTHGNGHLTIGQRFRDRGFSGGEVDELIIHRRALTDLEIAQHFDGRVLIDALAAPSSDSQPLFDYFVSAVDAPCRESEAQLMATRRDFVAAEDAIREMAVMEDMTTPRETHVLARGEYDAPRDESTRVGRMTPAALPSMTARGEVPDRLDLARWLTSPDHPLTARVLVNRVWANFFGQGLVGTAENFGLQGSVPTHPDLLDWLARDFVESGWDIHHLCRRIVLSATYGQDSIASPELRERDPENHLLARGPAHRLSAEQIRDLALAASALLEPSLGGPPVSPYQPGGDLWRESNGMSPAYRQSSGKGLHRRSLYSVWKRTAPLPNMMAFDSTTRETCAVSRSRTNTPLQALVLLNDVQFVESARALAERVIDSEPEDQIREAFLRLTSRPPEPKEISVLLKLHGSESAYFEENPDDAAKLIAHGDSKPDPKHDPARLAATTSVCLAILNLDSTIWKR